MLLPKNIYRIKMVRVYWYMYQLTSGYGPIGNFYKAAIRYKLKSKQWGYSKK